MIEVSKLYRLLFSLYVSQFIAIGFLTVGLAGILREQGVSLEKLGALQALGLIWALKFLWAPLVDRYGGKRTGHYRLWLLVFQTGMVVVLLITVFITPSADDLNPIVIVTALFVFFSSTQDIATDAIAVRLVDTKRRGMANGIQAAGGYWGNLLGGGLTIVVYDKFGWTTAVLLLTAMTSVSLITVVRFRERSYIDHTPTHSLRESYSSLWTVFQQKGSTRWAFVIVPLIFIGVNAVYSLITPALVDIGWSLSRIGLVVTVVASIPAIIGAIVGGWLISRYGRTVPMVAFVTLTIVATAGLIPVFSGSRNDPLIIFSFCLYLASCSAASAIVFTVNMDYAREKTAGSDYTMLGSVALGISFVSSSIILVTADTFGYTPVVIGSALILVVGLVLSIRYFQGHDQWLLEKEQENHEHTDLRKETVTI